MKNLLSLCALIGLSFSVYARVAHEPEAPMCAEDHRASERYYNREALEHHKKYLEAKARARNHLKLARACEQHEKHQKDQEKKLINKTASLKTP